MLRASGEGSFPGDPEDRLRKAPDTDISLHRVPFLSREPGIRREARVPETSMMNEGGL